MVRGDFRYLRRHPGGYRPDFIIPRFSPFLRLTAAVGTAATIGIPSTAPAFPTAIGIATAPRFGATGRTGAVPGVTGRLPGALGRLRTVRPVVPNSGFTGGTGAAS
ncbi:MAG: hypothetical protein R3F07_00370 [Opitutaceae bacterium]